MSDRKPRPHRRAELEEGQESVWDYPRPPLLEPIADRIRVLFGSHTIADTTQALRILETSHPPTVYIPPSDIDARFLKSSSAQTFCEWKGVARYYDVVLEDGTRVQEAAWYYPKPHSKYQQLANHVSFYPSRASQCYWGEELVRAQAGDFYGGWITSKIVGPFKGDAGTGHW